MVAYTTRICRCAQLQYTAQQYAVLLRCLSRARGSLGGHAQLRSRQKHVALSALQMAGCILCGILQRLQSLDSVVRSEGIYDAGLVSDAQAAA